MAVLPMRQAAQAAGVSRQTIYRLVQQGKVSAVVLPDGSKGVDTSELLRVFGQIREVVDTAETDAETVTGYMKRQRQDIGSEEIKATDLVSVRAELQATKDTLAVVQEQLTHAKDREGKLLEIVQSQTRLLEDKRPQQQTTAPPTGGLTAVALGLSLLAVVLVVLLMMR